MASEIRVNNFENLSGLGTVRLTNSGPVITGVVTATTVSAGDVTATSSMSGPQGSFDILNGGANIALHVDGGAPANSLHVRNDGVVEAGTSIVAGGNISAGAGSTIIVGDSFIQNGAVGLGTTTTSGLNAGVGTAIGTIAYDATTNSVKVYKAVTGWVAIDDAGDEPPTGIEASGGIIGQYTSGNTNYRVHTFEASGSFVVSSLGSGLPAALEYVVVAGAAVEELVVLVVVPVAVVLVDIVHPLLAKILVVVLMQNQLLQQLFQQFQ